VVVIVAISQKGNFIFFALPMLF